MANCVKIAFFHSLSSIKRLPNSLISISSGLWDEVVNEFTCNAGNCSFVLHKKEKYELLPFLDSIIDSYCVPFDKMLSEWSLKYPWRRITFTAASILLLVLIAKDEVGFWQPRGRVARSKTLEDKIVSIARLCPAKFQLSIRPQALHEEIRLVLFAFKPQVDYVGVLVRILHTNGSSPFDGVGAVRTNASMNNLIWSTCELKCHASNDERNLRSVQLHYWNAKGLRSDFLFQLRCPSTNCQVVTAWFFVFLERPGGYFCPVDRPKSHLHVAVCCYKERHHPTATFLKPMFNNLSVHLVHQWLDYHLFLGINFFYIHARSEFQREGLQDYIDKGLIAYVVFH